MMPRLDFSPRHILHLLAYVLAVFLALAIFFLALVFTESTLYALTGYSVSTWALVIAALITTLLFMPMVHLLERSLDRMVFPRQLDTLAAIQQLGAGDLAAIPDEDMEVTLLRRICRLTRRTSAALDERNMGDGQLYCVPEDARPPPRMSEPPLRLPRDAGYELCLHLPQQQTCSYLYLGQHTDGWPTMDDEIEALKSLGKFASMSLEHARLSRMQANDARLDSIHRIVSQLHSHDLKNRLHDLAFLAHNLQSSRLGEQEIHGLITAVSKVVDRMQILMNRLADPSAPLDPELKPMDVSQIIRSCIHEHLWPEGINIHAQIEELPLVMADSEMIRGVLDTLFDNAVHAMQGQGDLFVDASLVESRVHISVRDTGCGMSREFLDRKLFHLFASSKPNGMGIGLFLSRRIIEVHGGVIEARSEGEGKGCTFMITLPLWQA